MNTERQRPLSRFTILDATRVRAGPTAIRTFADLGARVIKLEIPPGAPGGDDMIGGRDHNRADYENLHRNKESLTLNMKEPEGKAILEQLVRQADVFIENYRPDVKYRLGIGPEELRRINPRLVYASISGFGQDGPYANWPGFDSIAQGMGGLMSVTGQPGEGPMRVGIPIADLCSGHFCAQAIMAALLGREVTGEGQWVHTSLLEGMLNKLDFQGARYTMSGEVPAREGNSHPTLAPMGTFRAADGWVNIAASSPHMWRQLCTALGAQALLADPRFADAAGRYAHRRELEGELEAFTQKVTCADLVQRLNPVGVPCGPVVDIGQAFEDPQARHLRMTRPAPHPTLGALNLVRSPINLSACPHPEAFACAAPDPGQHSAELLRELGYADDEMATMTTEGGVE